ncbi:glycerophosphodiester phosphodiesterase, partial [Lacticaseibacillus paracasei]
MFFVLLYQFSHCLSCSKNCPGYFVVLCLWYDVFFWKGAACMGKRLTLAVL